MSSRVYIGDLGSGGSKPEIEREFERFGTLKSVWVARNPPGFAFVEFEDARDAEDAVRDLDGRMVCGVKIRVELAKNSSRASGRGGGGGGGDRGYRGNGYSGGGGGRGSYRRSRSPPPRHYYSRSRSRSPDRRRRSPDGGRHGSPYRRGGGKGRDYSPQRY